MYVCTGKERKKVKKKKKIKKRVLRTLAIDSFPKPAPIIRKKNCASPCNIKKKRVKLAMIIVLRDLMFNSFDSCDYKCLITY